MRFGKLSTWLLRGTYPRLYGAIVLIILLVSAVRYHYLVATETEEVRRHASSELRRVGDAVLPLLAALAPADHATRERVVNDALLRFGPVVESLSWKLPGAVYQRPSDEHGILDLTSATERLKRGDKVLLVPGHCDPTVNLHDHMIVVRGGLAEGVVDAVVPVDARGAW